MSLTFNLQLGYLKEGGKSTVYGEATLTVEIEILMFSAEVSVKCRARVRRRRDADPRFIDLMPTPAGRGPTTATRSRRRSSDGAPIVHLDRAAQRLHTRRHSAAPVGHALAAARSAGSARAAEEAVHVLSRLGGLADDARERALRHRVRRPHAYRCRPRRRSAPNRVDDRLGLADSTVWKALFNGALSVKAFAYKDLSDENSARPTTRASWRRLIEQLYRDLARTRIDRMPLVTEVIEAERWRGLVGAVDELDGSAGRTATPACAIPGAFSYATTGRRARR